MGIWNVEKDVFECRKVCVVVMNDLISLGHLLRTFMPGSPGTKYLNF